MWIIGRASTRLDRLALRLGLIAVALASRQAPARSALPLAIYVWSKGATVDTIGIGSMVSPMRLWL